MGPSRTTADAADLAAWVDRVWQQEILPELVEYIRIPAKSPLFDPDWRRHGHLDRAFEQVAAWCRGRRIEGLRVELLRSEERTPLLLAEVPAAGDPDTGSTVLLYGHLDKQPEMTGWREDLGPWSPKIEDDRLYGRGGADDGYAVFASLAAIEALQAQGAPHPRCVVLIEGCEESGSVDLPAYIDELADRIGPVGLVICLDSFAGDYERLWNSTSLRGMVAGDLRVEILEEGVHSGDASGIVASTFRILRRLLDRVEDSRTGEVLLESCRVEIPSERIEQARAAAAVLGQRLVESFPFVAGSRPVSEDPVELLLGRTWRPALAVTGADGLPALADAGNVLRPTTAVKLSLRLPPTADWRRATAELAETLLREPPYGARVDFRPEKGANGWAAPPLADWLAAGLEEASRRHFGNPPVALGQGGSIPFMGMLGERYPEAQFLITGVLGPKANAHGPNEFLHIPCARKLTCCVAEVLTRAAAAC
ncbi:MAG: M20/M25/M40 family metallo-hydrolase [Planctomycetota bacterium]|nr:MAG: M20/M25/M40 family metallo-hydrolase [Planctomycetota bacterium]